MKKNNKYFWYFFSLIVSVLFFADPLSIAFNRKLIILSFDCLLFSIAFSFLFIKNIKLPSNIWYTLFLVFILFPSILFVGLFEGGVDVNLLNVKAVLIIIVVFLLTIEFQFKDSYFILFKVVGWLLVASLVFLVAEYYMQVYLGFLPKLVRIWGESGYNAHESLMRYHNYRLNGPLFGAQNASILCVMSLFYIGYTYSGLPRWILFALSCLCLYWTNTITAFYCLFIAVFALSYTYKNRASQIVKLVFILSVLTVPYTFFYLKMLRTGFNPEHISALPVVTAAKSQIYGTLQHFWKFPFGTPNVHLYIQHGDIAALYMLLRYGYIFMLFFVSLSMYSIVNLIKIARKTGDNRLRIIISYLVVLFMTIMHYNTLLIPGIFHIYIAFLSLGVIRPQIHCNRFYERNMFLGSMNESPHTD